MDEAVRDQENIDGEAAAWLAAIDCGTADRAAFERWRAADPAHALAFIRATQLGQGLDLLRETGLAEKPVFPDAPEESPNDVRPLDRRRFLKAGGAGALALGAVGIGWSVAAAAQDAQTAIGESRRIVIGRGISLDLNTDSHIRWRTRDAGFQIQLLKGELLLEREPGSAPCSIVCQDVRIEPAAGRIDTRLRENGVEVAVLHGEANVRSISASGVTRVATMQRTLLGKDARPVLSSMSETQAVATEAWKRGEVQFNGEQLDYAVAEYNRYLSRPLVIADESISRIRLGGRFSNSDPSDFLKALSVIYGVRVHEEADRVRLSRT
ncbi:DUF4880 domain-containing protein [Sphingomonas sp. dw_22]|uniref:FecR family protein n=1 Tax=Sphingomonas sp. dw_22 TaxID=2721175 RepID=UPI001BD34290|nr:DUF4880 domain-containing protein [Sphingomonas sp. dw_22]